MTFEEFEALPVGQHGGVRANQIRPGVDRERFYAWRAEAQLNESWDRFERAQEIRNEQVERKHAEAEAAARSKRLQDEASDEPEEHVDKYDLYGSWGAVEDDDEEPEVIG